MSDETRTVTVEHLAVALNETVGRHGWLRSTPPDPVEEWRMNAAAIFAALPTSTEGLESQIAQLVFAEFGHQDATYRLITAIRDALAATAPAADRVRALMSSSASDGWNAGVQAALNVLNGAEWTAELDTAPAADEGPDR